MRVLVIVIVCLLGCVYGHYNGMYNETMDQDSDKFSDNSVIVNFNEDCQGMISDIGLDYMETAYHYMAMAAWFRRHDVDIVGMSLMFNTWARKKIDMSKMMMMYIVKRGGTIRLKDIKKPYMAMLRNPIDALVMAKRRERTLNQELTNLAKHGLAHADAHLTSFLKTNVAATQPDYAFEIASYITKLEKTGMGFGINIINWQMLEKYRDFVDCESDVEKYKWNY